MVEGQISAGAPGSGSTVQQLRLITGLILFTFVATHLFNHALGLISLEAMDAFRNVRTAVTRSLPGTIVLTAALLTHVFLALSKVIGRRTWRMDLWEALQLGAGLLVPFLLLRHIIGMTGAHKLVGFEDDYDYALWAMWPGEAAAQAVLIVLAWTHGCIGMHFWLRMKPWYQQSVVLLYPVAVLLPVLSFAGFAVAGRESKFTSTFENPFTSEQYQFLMSLMDRALLVWAALIGGVIAYKMARGAVERLQPMVQVSYLGGPVVKHKPGATLLEISRAHGIPHASVCGGRARCSTCRVRLVGTSQAQPAPAETEQRVLARIHAGDDVRLACQLKPVAALTVMPLLPPGVTGPSDIVYGDRYLWGLEQTVTVLFADLRGFTQLSERALPFDIVFVLNQYLTAMSDAITRSGGYVDKFMGDGIMALFGMDAAPETGARQALAAAGEMGRALETINDSLTGSLPAQLNIGIGIHTGPAILGRIGAAGQSAAGRRITALGDTVNTASRLESACKSEQVQLIVSAQTVAVAGAALTAAWRRPISVRGRQASVDAYVIPQARMVLTPA